MAVQVKDGNNDYLVLFDGINQSVGKPAQPATAVVRRNSRPRLRLMKNPMNGSLNLVQKLHAEPWHRIVLERHGVGQLQPRWRQESIIHLGSWLRSSRSSAAPSTASISPRRKAARRDSASSAQADSTTRAASSSRLSNSASANSARSFTGSRSASRSNIA